MELLKIIIVSVVSIIVLFILTKIMGNRQMSELSMFDYITGITIGSIAAEFATEIGGDFWQPLVAMIVYALIATGISIITSKSIKIRRFITGKTLILFNEGKLYKENFKKAKLEVDEFLTICRNSGFFDLSQLQTAILEPNGKISFLPTSAARPINPQDMNLTPLQEKLVVNVIIDGKIMPDNLKYTGLEEKWLKNQLNAQNVNHTDQVFLATVDWQNNLNVYTYQKKKSDRDMFI